MIKKGITISIFGIFLIISARIKAQQLPIYQHSFLIRSAYNPAEILNKDSDLAVYILRGDQFSRFDGGFVNNYLNFASPLRKKNIGVGFELASRSFGIINQLSAGISYSYKARINKSTDLTLGTRLGFMEHKFNKYYLVIYQDNDAVIDDIPRGVVVPNGTFGMTLNSKIGSFEFSVPQLFSNEILKLSSNSNQNIILTPHYFARYTYEFGFNQDYLKVIPVVSIRFLPNTLAQYEAGVTAWVDDKFWINANLRSQFSASFGLGVKLFDSWVIGYSHDRPTQNPYSFYNSSNEVVIGYTFNKVKKPPVNRRSYEGREWLNTDRSEKIPDGTRQYGKVLMDSISPIQDPEMAKEFLKVQLAQKQRNDSLNNILEDKNLGYNYKKVLVQINLADSLFEIESSANNKNVTLQPGKGNSKKSNDGDLKNREKQIEEDRIIEELNQNRQEKIKIVRNTQPNEKIYVELSGEDSPRGYYLISGVFSTLERAQKFRWQNGSENSRIIINKTNKYFYVVQAYSPSKSIAELKKSIVDYSSKNKPIWILDY